MRKFFVGFFWLIVAVFGVVAFGTLGTMIISSFTTKSTDHPSETASSVDLESAVASDIKPDGELAEAFSFFSNYTSIQQKELENRITGKVVSWHLPVYDVDEKDDGHLVIQTTGAEYVGTFCHVRSMSSAKKNLLLQLKTGQYVTCKGVIKGTSFHNVVIDPAVFY